MQLQNPSVIGNAAKLIVDNYFSSINREDFATTVSLFAEEGKLLAPFEEPIIGTEAIASYLAEEAKGMKLFPQQIISLSTENNTQEIQVTGKVTTSFFSVNVAWFFILSDGEYASENLLQLLKRCEECYQIASVKIKLLASPKQLLGLQKFAKK